MSSGTLFLFFFWFCLPRCQYLPEAAPPVVTEWLQKLQSSHLYLLSPEEEKGPAVTPLGE